jgi:hypothetical protein
MEPHGRTQAKDPATALERPVYSLQTGSGRNALKIKVIKVYVKK